ncbi:Clp1/GlmU family protein [Metallosphaera hakonensis]|uniref:Clp1/GlmU family protein n=1 Tax=Metallosphaera hakonensis TaxID=79601 RepID=UPI0006D2BEE1|nr:Clp1/GlmU family protein [Metallosphaera hakonensis]
MRLDVNHDVVMRGPCEIRVIRGRVSILGLYSDYFILPDDTFSVSSHGDSEIETNCQYINTYPSLGLSNISDMIAMSGGKVVVLGESDAGKSYMSKTIYNTSDQFTYIDLDVGQSSLFLPTFVSSLRETKLWFDTPLIFTETFFFGDISPSRDPKRHIEISIKLVENEKNVIVDTDGWLKGGGEVHKRDLISQIDLITLSAWGRKL